MTQQRRNYICVRTRKSIRRESRRNRVLIEMYVQCQFIYRGVYWCCVWQFAFKFRAQRVCIYWDVKRERTYRTFCPTFTFNVFSTSYGATEVESSCLLTNVVQIIAHRVRAQTKVSYLIERLIRKCLDVRREDDTCNLYSARIAKLFAHSEIRLSLFKTELNAKII